MINLNQFINEVTSDIAKDIDFKDIKKYSEIIIEKYRDTNSKTSDYEIKDINEAISYMIYRMPATTMVIDEVLSRMLEINKDFNPQNILDIGSGTGASFIPLAYNFENFNLTMLEEQDTMIRAFHKLNDSLRSNNIFNPNENLEELNIVKNSILNFDSKDNKYELILLSYVLNELSEKEIRNLSDKLFELSNDTIIAIVPGTPAFYKKLEYLKGLLLDKGLKILAPCPQSNPCPINDDNWCHFYKRIDRSSILRRIKGGELSYEDEKFSYLVMTKKDIESNKYNRIVRHPIISKGNIDLELCTGDKLEIRKFTKNKDKDIYKEVKKLKWGDCFLK